MEREDRTDSLAAMCSSARDARWGSQLIALDTTLPWDVLGALPETFVTAAGSLEHLGLKAGRRCCCAARRPRSALPA
jgi:hypothetical protein